MMNWIDKEKDKLWDLIDDCFESLDVCEKCPNKQVCDDVWKIVGIPVRTND